MRTRIVALAVAAAALAIGLFGVPLAIGLAQFFVTDERLALQRVADFAAGSVVTEMAHAGRPTWLPNPGDDTELALYNDDGLRILGRGPGSGDEQVKQSLNGRASQTTTARAVIVTVPVSGEDGINGAVRAATPLGSVYRELMPVWLGMLGLAALVLTVVWAVARRQARRLARPLNDLANDAERLGEGDFSVQPTAVGIREIDSVGNALTSTASRLDALLARERAFSADASHQLRTPLAGLRLQLEAVLDQPEPDWRSEVAESLGAADRLQRTIDELLFLARELPGNHGAPADVHTLVSEIENGWGHRLAASGRALELDVAPQLPRPQASAAATRQALAVLLDNAELHGVGTVRVTVRETGDAIAVDVSDDGPGLDPDTPAAPFSSSPEHAPGHGIGLALARRLAEAEGGRLVLAQASPPVFTLFIPARWDPEPPADEGRDGVSDPDVQISAADRG
ncbi:HAMP domain-containing sensor histidine kinase [Pseudonocardia sp.]|jgi:signal transduction histidine kinase|uniref:sensor histidine kinase n=1 Tax=Pseudonocardia sp. TaxID=60912 RepID=UPI0031FD0634